MGLILPVLHVQVAASIAISCLGTADLCACTETGNIEPSAVEQELSVPRAAAWCSFVPQQNKYAAASDKNA